jgi:glycosyltransferase involved in cell wall biosynthesis
MLSVAIFAKNEEQHLERCLKSLKPLCPEIIFVDTGSTDKTVEIAKKYTNRIYHEPWKNDFAWHRNHSFSLCTGDWILQIDADEELKFENEQAPDKMLQALLHVEKNINAIAITIKDWRESTQTMRAESDNVRLFRRGKVNWIRRVHNESVFDGNILMLKYAHIVHYGYDLTAEQKEKKAQRTIGLLEESLKDDPGDYQSIFYLAQAYGQYKNDNDKVVEYSLEYISHKDELGKKFNSSIYHALLCVYLSRNELEKSKSIIDQALKNDSFDLDVIYDWMLYGLKIKDPKIIAVASQRFAYVFENMPKLRLTVGNRFFFKYNLESYAQALYYLSVSYLENGVIELNKLKDLFKNLSDDSVYKLKNKLSEDLSHLKIKGLIDEPKIITHFKRFNPSSERPGRIVSL